MTGALVPRAPTPHSVARKARHKEGSQSCEQREVYEHTELGGKLSQARASSLRIDLVERVLQAPARCVHAEGLLRTVFEGPPGGPGPGPR